MNDGTYLMDSKYIRSELVGKKPKTGIYDIMSKSGDYTLGQVKWYAPWRQYVFFPREDTIYSRGCMNDINLFIEELMEKRKT